MKISELRPRIRGVPLRGVLEHSQVQRMRLAQTMNNDPYTQILDAFFWQFVDEG